MDTDHAVVRVRGIQCLADSEEFLADGLLCGIASTGLGVPFTGDEEIYIEGTVSGGDIASIAEAGFDGWKAAPRVGFFTLLIPPCYGKTADNAGAVGECDAMIYFAPVFGVYAFRGEIQERGAALVTPAGFA